MTNALVFLWHLLVGLVITVLCLVLSVIVACVIIAIIEIWRDNRR